MEWVEKLVGTPARNVSEPEFPPSLFYCRLDEQPDHLVPEYALATTGIEATDLSLHPQCFFTRGRELPPHLSGKESLVENFALQGPVAWTPHPASGVPQPFWLTAELEDRLLSGALSELAPDLQKTLLTAGVAIHRGGSAGDWEMNIARGASQFRERGYAPLAGMIHPFHVAALRRYYRHRIRTGGMILGDGQSPRRYVAHNESIACFFHHQLTPLVAAVAGEAVKPSYVYAASYQGGARLERHTDREQCEFSVTFCLDYSPEPSLATGWPLQLHVKTGMVTVYQAIGDALLYRGRELPHSRKTLRPGQTSTSIFFHYVREDFAGSLD
jgi:hypothetical protein